MISKPSHTFIRKIEHYLNHELCDSTKSKIEEQLLLIPSVGKQKSLDKFSEILDRKFNDFEETRFGRLIDEYNNDILIEQLLRKQNQ